MVVFAWPEYNCEVIGLESERPSSNSQWRVWLALDVHQRFMISNYRERGTTYIDIEMLTSQYDCKSFTLILCVSRLNIT